MFTLTRLPLFAVMALIGCSSMPAVQIGYYLPKGVVGITVTQTAACTAAGVPVFTDNAEFTPEYSSDESKRRSISLLQLGSGLSKADVSVDLHPDGRLKSVNTKSSGQPADALRAFVKAAVGFTTAATTIPKDTGEACKAIAGAVGEGKALSIVHRGVATFDADSGRIDLTQSSVQSSLYSAVRPVFGTVTATYTVKKAEVLTNGTQGAEDGALLELVEPALGEITVTVDRGQAGDKYQKVAVAPVPQRGRPYSLPIQKAPWLGTNDFELVLDASGRITRIRYAATSDAAGGLGFLSDVTAATASKPESATEKAKREADEIYQQQRLILCQTTPKDCPK